MRRGFEQESRYTLSKHSKEFKNKVRVLIENDDERSAFFEALKAYQESNSITKLVSDLKAVINTPKRHPLFREVRYLIKPTDTTSYLNLIPKSPSDGIRLIRVQHFGNGGIGFSVRGGREHGIGIFVSLVTRRSQADIVGLRAGDEILSINGLYLADSTHAEVVNILRSRKNILLKVRSTGKVPCKIHDVISWETAEGKENVYYHPDLLDYLIKEGDFLDDSRFEPAPDDKKVTLIVGTKGIGCSVRNGIPGKEGLFVISVTSGSLADKTGVRIGDQIVAVNGKNIMKLRYSEAIYLLKSFKELNLVLRHSKEAEVFIMAEIAKQQEDKMPEFAIKTQLLTRKAEEKEKLEKAKEQMHFQQLKEDMILRNESMKEVARAETTDEENPSSFSSSEKPQPPKRALPSDSVKREGLSETVQIAVAGPSNSQHKKTVIAEVHTTPSSESNTFKFEDDLLKEGEAHFLRIEKVSELGLELEERDGGIFVKEVQEFGSVAAHGGVQRGDQVLNVEGVSLLGLTVEQAREELYKAMNRDTEHLDLVVAVSQYRGKRREIFRSGSVVRKRDPVTGNEVYDTWL
ncbi:harmonin-like [Montipora capricornis]|uniref:harmonin-like n=1 Tax=Montipora capricornis TaxID=246305 RepID=UPI0035F16B3A